MSELYREVRAQQFAGETNDCSVIGLSIACQVHYGLAHRVLGGMGRRQGKGIQMATLLRAVEHLGYAFEDETPSEACTVASIGRRLGPGRFLVLVRGHVIAVVDGVVEDWTAGRRHKVRRAWRIVPKG